MTVLNTALPRCAAALSTLADTREAAREVCQRAKAELGAAANLVIAFASIHHQPNLAALAETLHAELAPDCLLGCTGESIVCGNREIEPGQSEHGGALALWAAHLPGVSLRPMHLDYQQTADGGAFIGWPDELPDEWPADASLLVLAEPFSFPADMLLARLNQSGSGVRVIGGMVSGGWIAGQNRLIFGPRELDSGAVAVLVHGAVKVRSIVSQGCRPIGRAFVVTKAEGNVIFQLGGRPAFEQLQEMFQGLSDDEQQLARQGLHVGQVINEYQEQFGRGDFLIRNVQAVDPKTGAIAIGDYVRVGQTIQFHVRDADTADEDLNALLAAASAESAKRCLGGLMFSCNGRGTRLFDQPHHDATAVDRHWPNLPLAGFFAQGEIGPVGGKSFLHGFTASIALFETK